MSEPLVLREDDAGVTTLTLNRPDKLNALSPTVFVELRRHLDAIAEDGDVRCVVLTGAGRSFCAGHDLAAISSQEALDHRFFEAETVDLLEQLPQPTVAKLRGYCLTGGLELALGCDLLVAAASTKIGDTHGRWGLVPVWGMSVRLPERVGRSTAKELMFTSRVLDGTTAQELGLVDRVVSDADLDRAVDELVAEVCRNSPGTNRIVKRLLARHDEDPRSTALRHERDLPYGLPEDLAERMAAGGR